jgi:choline dehydrogenase-like flavoprotein
VMGGCGLGGDERLGVVRPDGVHWQLENLSVHDGSLFPTSIGANPQLSIYGIVNRLAQALAQRLGGGNVMLA